MISIVSYGSGNVKAILNIYRRLNIPSEIADTPEQLLRAKKLILPGVGAFDQTMKQIEEAGFRSVLDELVLSKNIPILGVCVGMQIMAKSSEEGARPGLGWLNAEVKKVDISKRAEKPGLPHMGWNSVEPKKEHPILNGVDPERGFYFLHSFAVNCNEPTDILTTTQYGEDFASSVATGNLYGFQFHPEKSHQNGIQLFQNFADLQ